MIRPSRVVRKGGTLETYSCQDLNAKHRLLTLFN